MAEAFDDWTLALDNSFAVDVFSWIIRKHSTRPSFSAPGEAIFIWFSRLTNFLFEKQRVVLT